MKIINNKNGFSLIELMIVIAIIGVIASLALPSYREYIIRTNHVDAKDKLTEVMFQQERYVIRNRSYTADLTNLGFTETGGNIESDEGFYAITAAACQGTTLARCVLLTATPVADRRQAGNGNFTLDSRGEKTYTGTTRTNWE